MSSLKSPSSIHLEKGLTVIEASAGTGKTYTLARLAARFIIETGMTIDRLAIVTFTEAATAELKDRIRGLFRLCVDELEADSINEDILLFARDSEAISTATIKERLLAALDQFDEAAISTIHGFCKRALDEAALEGGISFDSELKNIDQELVNTIRSEYIRSEIAEYSPLIAAALYKSKRFKGSLEQLGRELRSHPFARINPPAPPEDPRTALKNAFQIFLSDWQKDESRITNAFSTAFIANRKSTKALRLFAETASRWRAGFHPQPDEFEQLLLLQPEPVSKALKKGHKDLAELDFFKSAASLQSIVDKCSLYLIHNYKYHLFKRLREEKGRLNAISFNDLLQLLANALRSSAGERVQEAISSKFDAALVDEFQDTDPTQFEILSQLFGNDDHYLFFIGDPKQAIYRFRGADIFTYIQATQGAEERLHLSHNYRSHPRLVDAHNAFFRLRSDLFRFEEIEYTKVEAGLDESKTLQWKRRCGTVPAPFQILIPKGNSKPQSQNTWVEQLARWTTLQLQDLLSEDHRYGERRVEASDVAVLVNANSQADVIHNSLQKAGLESLIVGDRSIFQSDQAKYFSLLLAAIETPSRIATVRAALTTPLFGFNVNDFLDKSLEAKKIDLMSVMFFEWNRDWHNRSFSAILSEILRATGGIARLAKERDGEKSISNILQLADILHAEKAANRLSPSSLQLFIKRKCESETSGQSEWQQKVPSDEKRIRIYTIHKSKGLEFAFVFCPFIGLVAPRKSQSSLLYHASNDSDSLTLDLSPEPSSATRSKATNEDLAEFARLLYVALTRAKAACWLVIPPFVGSRTQSGSSLIEIIAEIDSDSWKNESLLYEALGKALKPLALKKDAFSIQELDCSALPRIEYRPIHNEGHPATLSSRVFERSQALRAERIMSFSSLSQSSTRITLDDESPDRDRSSQPEEPIAIMDTDPSPFSIFSLPKGTKTGDLFHAILEIVDFAKPKTWSHHIQACIQQLSYPHSYAKQVLQEQLTILMAKALKTESYSIKLGMIPPSDRIAELEFFLPSRGQLLGNLQSALKCISDTGDNYLSSWASDFQQRVNPNLSSQTRGFIDLVACVGDRYYIIDWKSNHLGNQVENYSKELMEKAMTHSDYHLQYLIYTVALTRYLRLKLPNYSYDRNFGGVFYIFLRGIKQGAEQNGIYFAKPSEELVENLNRAFL